MLYHSSRSGNQEENSINERLTNQSSGWSTQCQEEQIWSQHALSEQCLGQSWWQGESDPAGGECDPCGAQCGNVCAGPGGVMEKIPELSLQSAHG